ncbi:MAG: non-canonical purine NTP pyrophosphatase, RdgB/HAM1 family [Candidatus Melainabacteria bacterium GWF2_32_7]|nr:MAG: non-canonical purine NTP pyrophosphatase, RdgB/HAM1 family [Candidatus Melainabacteria bacterium GWF2_32_7]
MVQKINTLVFATKNKNKLAEVINILKDTGVSVCGVEGEFDPEETGATFEENAYIKAFEAAKIMNMPAFGDDSGLVVDALDGRPGVYSSRYAENDKKRIEKLLEELKGVPQENRTARFVCAMVIVNPEGETLFSCQGICEGLIIDSLKGANGFGYDPIFFIPEKNATMAELSMDEKNTVSHRGKALKKIIEWLLN